MAHVLKTKAYVIMPENANRLKMRNAQKWGAEITLCEPTIEARVEAADRLAYKTGGVIIPPFEHEWIVEGQATAAMDCRSAK